MKSWRDTLAKDVGKMIGERVKGREMEGYRTESKYRTEEMKAEVKHTVGALDFIYSRYST